MVSLDDTIVAISTPVGEGGIGIVRMTGPDALNVLLRLFRPRIANEPFLPGTFPASGVAAGQDLTGLQPATYRLQARTLHYGHIVEPTTGQRVDEVLAVHMPAPCTYTRQDVVEINGHGGWVALQRILALCLRQGARLAEPGEFTARAFLNGRLDLAQAEAVLDVVRARTDRSLQAAMGQLAGNLSDQLRSIRATLVDALAYLEATIDFTEDEIPERDLAPALKETSHQLGRLLDDADRGILYRHGVRAAIIGRPNVGKSSLLNRLLRTNRAIVTDIPGTTRDTLEETVNLQGIPFVLVDTAGITVEATTVMIEGHRAPDPIEQLGVERSRAALAQADLALLVVDASQPLTKGDWEIGALVGTKPAIVVHNKLDLVDATYAISTGSRLLPGAPGVALSALTGEGREALEAAMVDKVLAGQVTAAETPLVTSPRHKEALSRAMEHVNAAHDALDEHELADLVAIDLAAAVSALGEITGQSASADLIEAIFGNFCVGK